MNELQIFTNENFGAVRIIEEDGKVLGYCFCIHKEFSGDSVLTNRKELYIDDLCVDEAARGKGVASAMLSEIEDWGREKRAVYAILCSANHRLEAHKLYEKVGYSNVKGYKKYL